MATAAVSYRRPTAAPALDASTFDFTTHDAEVDILNPATGNRRTLRIVTQPANARFKPGERLAEVLVDPEGDEWLTFAFVSQRGVTVWPRHRGTACDAYARMLENPRRYVAQGLIYRIVGS